MSFSAARTVSLRRIIWSAASFWLSASLKADYLFGVGELQIDAQNSTHFSRYFNHAEYGTLTAAVDSERRRVDFFAARDITAGEELTFDCRRVRLEPMQTAHHTASECCVPT